VCGVGGAIILGALAYVAWRIWGNRGDAEEKDGLMGYRNVGSSSGKETSASGAPNPFQSTLESYHAPGRVNASANF